MKNLVIKRVIQIKPYFTADEWRLNPDDIVMSNVAAQALNQTLSAYVNRGETRAEVARFVRGTMSSFGVTGAMSVESLQFLDSVLDLIFLEEDCVDLSREAVSTY